MGWAGRFGCCVWVAEALWGFSAVCQPLTDDQTLAPPGGEPVVVCVAPTLSLGLWSVCEFIPGRQPDGGRVVLGSCCTLLQVCRKNLF